MRIKDRIKLARLVTHLACIYGLTEDDVMGKGKNGRSRKECHSVARLIFYFCAYTTCGYNYTEIARLANRRCHGTIISGVRTIKNHMSTNTAVSNHVEGIIHAISNHNNHTA